MITASTYNDYLEKTQPLTFEQMVDIHQQIVDEIRQDEALLEHYKTMIKAACAYASERASWFTAENGMLDSGKNDYRTDLHNDFIKKLNALTQQLRRQGKNTAWRDVFGDDNEVLKGYKRKMAGDFACFLAFVVGINER